MRKDPLPKREDIIAVIDQSSVYWNNIQISDLGFPCAICNYMKAKLRLEWEKGNKAGVCVFCPVYFTGLFFICKSIAEIVPVDSLFKVKEFDNIRKLVLQKLKVMRNHFSKEDNWKDYIEYVKNKKSFRGTVIKRAQEIPVKKRRVIRRKGL